ncbi:MAG TPA: PAS domain S-box protein [Candidatus Binatia bacterium]
MFETLSNFFTSEGFEPHGHCFLWQRPLLWLYVASDSLIAISYYIIPIALVIFVRKRQDLAFNWMFLMFSAFIFACGTTHLMGIWKLWEPVYWLDGSVKAITAGLSVATAATLWPLIPQALALPSPRSLELVNQELQQQIAEREFAAQKLRETETLFRSLLESAPDAMVIVDAQGMITLVNSQTERLFGYERKELLGKPVEHLVPARFRERHQDHRGLFAKNPHVRPMGTGMELFAVRRDGSEFPVEISLSPIATGRELLMSAAIRDITERKRAERLLQEKERLATLGTTAAVFAHEIGNPLNGISTSLQIVKSILETDKIDPVLHETLEIAFQEVQRLATLLSDYRTFARPQRLNLRPADVTQIIEEVLSAQLPMYRGTKIALQTELENLPAMVVDPEKIKQVILNLCKNAVEAMPNGGSLTVKATGSEGGVILEVTDTGEGIAHGVDVFQLFRTTKPDGTGLGLPIVQQIISDHRGTITYRSEIGKGTTFTIGLPAGVLIAAGANAEPFDDAALKKNL